MSPSEQEVLIRILVSLNMGDTNYSSDRVQIAKKQLDQLKELGCKF